MDFQSFPTDQHRFDTTLIITCQLTKQPISIPCHKKTDAKDLAHLFMTHFFWYYGAPETIVLDCRPQFISTFWQAFCRIISITLKLSTTRHPETDGQMKIVNQHITMRL